MIDDVTWGCATRLRRTEWQQTITEFVDEAVFTATKEDRLRAYVTVHKEGLAVDLHDSGGRQVGRLELPQHLIAPVFREYMDIIREMLRCGNGANSPKLEALDIAKKLSHDDAAELLQRHFRDVVPDHNTARRLFTLLVVLTHDTTRLGQKANS